MNQEMEERLGKMVFVPAEDPKDKTWHKGCAYLGNRLFPCYASGGGMLSVIAYGECKDGPIMVCANRRFIKPEIKQALDAFEPGAHWVCEYEHSCGALLATENEEVPRYLVIEGTGGHIGFPKGHIEQGETIPDTVARELREEVNVTEFTYIEGYRVDQEVITRKNRQKTVTYFLATFDPAKNELRRQEEEIVNLWLLPYKEARERVNTELDRELLDKANEMLSKARP